MPKIVTPRPACASALPQSARGRLPGAAQRLGAGRAAEAHAAGELGEGAEHQPGGERRADRRQHRAAGLQRPGEGAERHGEREHAPERLHGAVEAAALPGQRGAAAAGRRRSPP